MNIIYKKISEIKPYDRNPRINDGAVPAVAASIQEYGFKVPIVIDKDGIIIAGHTRLKAAKKLKMLEVPCLVADDLTPEQVKQFRLVDNKVGELATWDFALLDQELAEIDIDMSNFGFEDVIGGEKLTAEEDDYEEPEEIETDIKYGDIFQIGQHRLMCGDSTKKEDVEKLMNGEKADLGLTDPPYNIGYNYNSHNDNMTNEEYNDFIVKYVNNLIENSDKQIITSGKQNVVYYYKNFNITEFAVWYAKNKMSGSKISNLGLCEPILFIGKFNRKSRATDMFEYNVKQQENTGGHTCPKIIDFFAELLRCYSKKCVLDLFLGSGTTMVACHQLNRKCFGMELDPKYCQVIIDRMQKLDPTLEIKKVL